jgi:hypothetical protein
MEQKENGEEEEKGTSDDDPENDTFTKVKRMPRRSLFMEEMTIPLPKPHTTTEKTLVTDMTEDNLESCMTKTQELVQDTYDQQPIFDRRKIDENWGQHQGHKSR